MKDKNILVLANSSGGLYEFRGELLSELAASNNVYASLPDAAKNDLLKEAGVHTIHTDINRHGINPIEDFRLFAEYVKLIKKIRPHIVLTYTIKPNIYGGMACSLMGIPFLANITGLGSALENPGMVGKVAGTLYKIGLKKASVVYTQNEYNREFILKKRIAAGEQVRLLPGSGVNISQFKPTPMPEKPGFIFISRVMAAKGIDEYLQAAERINGELKPDTPMFTVLGALEEEYGDRIKDLAERGVIDYPGRVPDVRPFLSKSQCLVHPSYYSEGMSNVCLEAAASGRAVITTRHPGCQEAVMDGKSGFLVKKKDAEALYTAMKQFMGLSYEEKCSMGEAGRIYVEGHFDRRLVVDEYLRTMNSLL